MKKTILIFCILLYSNCTAQKPIFKDLSSENKINYIFARIIPDKTKTKSLFDRGLFVSVFQLSDSKATPKKFSIGTREFLDSYIISVTTDGDGYLGSKLYKIEGIYDPKIVKIKEGKYPKFIIEIEYGEFKKRKIKSFELIGAE